MENLFVKAHLVRSKSWKQFDKCLAFCLNLTTFLNLTQHFLIYYSGSMYIGCKLRSTMRNSLSGLICFFMLLFTATFAEAQEAENPVLHRMARQLELAGKWMDEGRYEEALRLLGDISTQHPNIKEAWFGKGQCADYLGKPEDAIAHYSVAIALDPTFTEALFNRAILYHRQGSHDFAIADFSALLQLEQQPTTQVYYQTSSSGDIQKLSTLQSSKALIYYHRGLAFNESKHYQDALNDLNQAIKLQDKEADYYVARAQVLENTGQKNTAIADYRYALQINPSDERARRRLYQLGDSQAMPQPDSPEAFATRASELVEQGALHTALAFYDSAILLAGQADIAWLMNRALLLEKLQRYEAALADYNRALRISSKNAKVHAGMGSVYFKQKQYDKARDAYTMALVIEPGAKIWYYNRALCHRQLGALADACADLQVAANHLPQAKQALAKWCR
jgi:tetratricopeptide (TPR) repeat protein